MNWLLIGLCVILALSPLVWLKPSSHQKRVAELRRQAGILSLHVNLRCRPDARDGETQLDSVCYRLPWLSEGHNDNWVLHRYSQRGWESHCDGWRWFSNQADPSWATSLSKMVTQLPFGVSALIANREGIGVIWDERGDQSDIRQIFDCLQLLRQESCKGAIRT
jgi:hypothetical protein